MFLLARFRSPRAEITFQGAIDGRFVPYSPWLGTYRRYYFININNKHVIIGQFKLTRYFKYIHFIIIKDLPNTLLE
jgi:hypothetical protein